MSTPSIAVVGPGAVGSFLAAHLAAAGREVVACGRRRFERYVIESTQFPADQPARVEIDPDRVDPVDVVLVCVKVTQTPTVGPWLARLCGPETVVVSVQNGIESEDLLRPLAPRGDVVPSVVYCGVQLLEPGHVRHTNSARLVLPDSDPARRAASAFDASIVRIRLAEDFRTEAWRKLGVNVTVNGITALTNRTTDVFQRPDTGRLARDLLRECWHIARLDGADLDDDAADEMVAGLIERPIGAGTSMLYDRRAGRATEHDAIYGAVVRAAERVGADAPLARTVQTLLAAGDPG
ncbi:MAG: 2-dehydropantoate 2-reductase [Ilumatobacteraceae bacterium]